MSQDISMGVSTWESQAYSRDVNMQTASLSHKSRSRHSRPARSRDGATKVQSCATQSFQAPTGLTDSDDDSDGPSFSIRAPTGYTDSDEDEVTSRPARVSIIALRTPSPAQQAMHELEYRLQSNLLREQMQLQAREKAVEFQRALQSIDEQEREEFARIEALIAQKQAREAGQEAARQAVLSEKQKELVSGLQQEHHVQAAAMDQQAKAAIKQAEEARQRKLQEDRQREEARTKEVEMEAKRQADAAARKLEEEQMAAQKLSEAEAMRQKKEAEDAQNQKEAPNRKENPPPGVAASAGARVSPEAAAFELDCSKALLKAKEAVKEFEKRSDAKTKMRPVFRTVNKIVSQLGGTQQQVNTKTEQILELLSGLEDQLKTYALLQLSQGFIDLSEGVESRFPVAKVATNVCNAYPEAVLLLMGKLHDACPLAVPKSLVRLKSESEDDYLKRWRYQRVEVLDKKTKKMVEGWEEKDVFLQRVTAHVQFLAAFMQTEAQRFHGLGHAWSYLARLLNALPPNRYTAFALVAFIEISGYKLHQVYRHQFVKLLMYIDQHFVNEIIERGLEDARSAVRRLRQYLQGQEFLREPLGCKLEMYDASSYDRA